MKPFLNPRRLIPALLAIIALSGCSRFSRPPTALEQGKAIVDRTFELLLKKVRVSQDPKLSLAEMEKANREINDELQELYRASEELDKHLSQKEKDHLTGYVRQKEKEYNDRMKGLK